MQSSEQRYSPKHTSVNSTTMTYVLPPSDSYSAAYMEAERLHYSQNKEAYAVITTSDGRKFPDTHEGRESAKKREKMLGIMSIQQQVDPKSPILSIAGDKQVKDCNTTTNRRAS